MIIYATSDVTLGTLLLLAIIDELIGILEVVGSVYLRISKVVWFMYMSGIPVVVVSYILFNL